MRSRGLGGSARGFFIKKRLKSSPGRPLGDNRADGAGSREMTARTENVSPQTLVADAVGRCHPTSTRSCAHLENEEAPRASQRSPSRLSSGCVWPFVCKCPLYGRS